MSLFVCVFLFGDRCSSGRRGRRHCGAAAPAAAAAGGGGGGGGGGRSLFSFCFLFRWCCHVFLVFEIDDDNDVVVVVMVVVIIVVVVNSLLLLLLVMVVIHRLESAGDRDRCTITQRLARSLGALAKNTMRIW